MSDLGRLTVSLYANSAQFVSELNRSQRQAQTWSSKVSGAFKATAAATAAAAVGAAGGIAALYAQQSAVIDQAAKLSDSLGISTEAYTRLRYAADLSGATEAFDGALESMVVKLGEATFGAGEAAEALDILGLNAQEMGKLTPEAQLLALSDALKTVENQSQRTFITDSIFGGPEMMIMLNQGAAGINAMTAEADQLGITLSRIDAAKVEMANDAMHRSGIIATAVGQSLTTQLAPFVAALATEFTDYAKQFGGMNNMIAEGIHATTKGVGFMADAFHGVQIIVKGVEVTGLAMLQGMRVGIQGLVTLLHGMGSAIFDTITWSILKALDAVSVLSDKAAAIAAEIRAISDAPPPKLFDGVDINNGQMALNNAIWELRTLAAEPLPSEGIDAWYQATKTKFDQIATDYANTVNKNGAGNTLVTIPEEAAKTGTAKKDGPDPAVAAFQTATNQLQTEWQRRLQLQMAGDQATAMQEQFAYEDRLARLSEQYQTAYANSANNHVLQQQLENEYFASREALWAVHEANITEIEKQAANDRLTAQAQSLANYGNVMGQMSDTAKTFAGEQSGIYKAMFAASKAFAIAESIVKIQQGIANAAALPFPANIPAMATVAASTMSIVSTISGTNLQGMAHNGISSVPNEGTWLLDKGERVYTNDSATKLDQMHSAIMQNRGNQSQGGVVVKIENAPSGYGAQATESEDEFGRRVIRVILQDMQNGGDVTEGYQQMWNLQRHGRY